jgi:hypothetical protein
MLKESIEQTRMFSSKKKGRDDTKHTQGEQVKPSSPHIQVWYLQTRGTKALYLLFESSNKCIVCD